MTTTCPVIHFDHQSKEVAHNRDHYIRELRKHPVAWTQSHGGFWVIASHELAKRILADPGTFSSLKHGDGTGGVTIPPVGVRLSPAEYDPPYHDVLRRMLNPWFNKPAVDKLRPMVETVVSSAIDRVIEKDDFDVVHDIADVIPATVIVTYLGFPVDQRVSFIKSVQASLSTAAQTGDGEQSGMEAFTDAVTQIFELAAERRTRPADDMMSHLVNQTDVVLDDEELLWLIFTLIVGGTENPAALISNSLLHLAQDCELRQRLIDQPGLIPAATDEFLRFFAPGVSTARTATRDVELDGVRLAKGDRVLMWIPAINHDETVFADPDSVDVDRGGRQHLAFGYGQHFCVGAMLGRLEANLIFSEVLTRMPEYSVDISQAKRFDNAAIMYGWWTVPARANV